MFQRLVAIPQEEYAQLTTMQQVRQPMLQQFHNLESKYRKDEYIHDPYTRLIAQSETLDEMKELKQKMREGIVSSTPKIYQTRARMLYQSTEPFMKFNERGEIYDEHGTLIENSRLEDLVQYAVRDRRRNIKPVGWNAFVNIMRNNNVPKYVLNRYTIDELHRPIIKKEKEETEESRKRSASADSGPVKKRKFIEAKRLSKKVKRRRSPSDKDLHLRSGKAYKKFAPSDLAKPYYIKSRRKIKRKDFSEFVTY